MPEKLPYASARWIKNTSQFNEDLIKSYNEDNDEGYFLEVDAQYPVKFPDRCNDLSL